MLYNNRVAVNGLVERLELRRLFSGLFGLATSYPTTGSGSEQILTADFNQDKLPDIAVANYNDASVSIFLNQGKGKFKLVNKLIMTGTGENASSIAIGDFNGDGKPDLAIVGSDLIVADGTGNGQFGSQVHYTAGSSPQNVVAFSAGGKLDLAVTDVIGDAVLIFKNNGQGQFGTATTIPGIPGAAGIVAGDFTGDGKVDLAVTSFGHVSFTAAGNITTGPSDGVRLLPGDGKGNFAFGSRFRVFGSNPTEITAADLNGDGKLDIVTTDGGLGGLIGTSSASVLQNYGGGHFAYPRVLATGGSPQFVSSAEIGGKLDIVTADEMGNDISIFSPRGSAFHYNAGLQISTTTPVDAIVADVNGDGIPDLLTESNTGDTLSVFLGV